MAKEFFPFVVRKKFAPYTHDYVANLLKKVQETFGPTFGESPRWMFKVPFDNTGGNNWELDFYFAHHHDQLLFCLKYLGETGESS